MQFIRETSEGIVFKIFLQPRASKDEIVGLHGDRLKIKVAAPPVEGEANKRCIQFLAKRLSVPRSTLQILSGHNSRNKIILLKSEKTPPAAEAYAHLKQQIHRIIKSSAEQMKGKRTHRPTGTKKALD
jgi:uncharacterized protein